MKRLWDAALILIVVSLLLFPTVYSEDFSAPGKTLDVFSEVVGIDIAAYNATLDLHVQDLFFETLPQEHVKFILESEESKLESHCTFVDQKIESIGIYVLDGLPLIPRSSTDPVEMAEAFLIRYQNFSGASYCDELISMLDAVEAYENVTRKSGNLTLEVKYDRNHFSTWGNKTAASFRWRYEINGVEVSPRKGLRLTFENGYFKHFSDKWSLYQIGNYHINLTEEEAIEAAVKAAQGYSWNVSMGGDKPPVKVTEFNVIGASETRLMFGNAVWKQEARDGTPLTLYPRWHIYLYFDKLYPGQVYGLSVGIWADTGEVHDIQAAMLGLREYSPNGEPIDNLPPFPSIIFPQNQTYTDNQIALNFTTTESSSWVGYSLDGEENVTLTGNATITGLSGGSHTLTVYANDTAGNMAASGTVYFAVAREGNSFPVSWLITVLVVAVMVGVVWWGYRRTVEEEMV